MRNYGHGRFNVIADTITNLLFPRHCAVCDDIVPLGDGLVCELCAKKIRYIKEPRCRICGKQLFVDTQVCCSDCAGRKHVFDYGYSLYDYKSMRKSLYRFKYQKRCEYAKFYAQDISVQLKKELYHMRPDAIVPVPVHTTRLRERGYNQAELVAVELSGFTGIPVYTKVVKRVKKTVPQKELGLRERQNNLKKAFNIASDVVKLNKIVLIDDIYTTGATLDAMAAVLKSRGVEIVNFITLSAGEGV